MSVLVQNPARGVRSILINRPEARNAIDAVTRQALLAALQEARRDEDVRAVIIGGAGGIFSAGGDLPSMVGLDREAASARLREGHVLASMLWSFPKPVIAAVERVAAGAAVGLALIADELIMGTSASFVWPFLKLGLVPDWGLTASLPKRVGWAKAAKIFRDGVPTRADQALRIGLCDAVVEDELVMSEAVRTAELLATNAPHAFARFKQLMRSDAQQDLGLVREAEAQVQSLLSPEFEEGFAAFKEKRSPRF